MRNLTIRNIIRIIALLALQILILNNVYLGAYIHPFIYVMFILMLPNKMGKVYILLASFAAGLSVDIFSNMLGFHACAATVVAFCRITFADRIITRAEDISIPMPSIFTVSPQYFLYYSGLLLMIYYLVYFSLETFSISDIFNIILESILSTIATLIMIVVWQLIFLHKK